MLSRMAGEEVRLLQVGRGTFDSMPVSVLATATVGLLSAHFGGAVDVRRFRPNILVDSLEARETDWVGGTLVFGDTSDGPRLRANLPIDRCVMITIDPETGARNPKLLRGVVEDFNNEIAIRGATEATGTIRVGDPVRLVR
jgi:hypothetical protein